MSLRPDLRKMMRSRRRALDETQRRRCAEQVTQRFAATRMFRTAQHIGLYFPADGELNTIPLMQRAWAMGKYCYLPVLHGRAQHLRFAAYYPDEVLAPNRLGILEPQRPLRERISAARLDVILLPLTAFDTAGNRLGMGAGFYDRTLAFRKQRHCWQHPHLFGLGYDFQRVGGIVAAAWDVRLDGVVTEAAVYWATR
jgi:5-formyltetrahydrofolate cyclo-ligase